MLAFVLSRELCSRAELHGVSIGDGEDFSLPGVALEHTDCSALMLVYGVQILTVRQLFVVSDGDWFLTLFIAEGSVVVRSVRF